MHLKLKKNWMNGVLLSLIILVVVGGYFYAEQIKQDYNRRLEDLSSDFQEEFQEQQERLDQLQLGLENASQQIGETQKLYSSLFPFVELVIVYVSIISSLS